MAKITINIKADKDVKKRAQKVARELGIPLSTVINAYLHQFVRTKSVHFYVPEGELKPSAKRRLNRLAKEAREGKNLSPAFTNMEDAIGWLDA
jgi:addiction module RelB/DinJ family antitoxin